MWMQPGISFAERPLYGGVLGIARDYLDSPHGHLTADVQPDADLTRIIVARRMQYVQTLYIMARGAWARLPRSRAYEHIEFD